MTRLAAPPALLALLLASAHARASEPLPGPTLAPAEPAPPAAPAPAPSPPRLLQLAAFGVELGGSPGLFGAKVGVGGPRGDPEGVPGRWMAWLEADGTDWFRPSHPADPGRVDQLLWFFPHLELSQQLSRRWPLAGFARAGPTVVRYTAGSTGSMLWAPGVALGAGLSWTPIRVGVTFYGQWKTATLSSLGPPASPDVRIEPMVLFTAGLELVTPIGR